MTVEQHYLTAAVLVNGWMREYYRYLVDGDPANGLHPKAKAALTLKIAAEIEAALLKYDASFNIPESGRKHGKAKQPAGAEHD